MSASRFILIFVSFFILIGSAFSQNYRRIERAGIKYSIRNDKPESMMASDNGHNRKTICCGTNDDGHYILTVYYHRGYFYNEVWGAINGAYSVDVYSTLIESDQPIECTHFNYASFPNADLITLCQKYGIKELIFFKD